MLRCVFKSLRLADCRFSTTSRQSAMSGTLQLEFMLTLYRDTVYHLEILDLCPVEEYTNLNIKLLQGFDADIFMYCFNVAEPESLEGLKEECIPRYSKLFPGHCSLIVGLCIDLREVPRTLERLAKKGERPITSEEGLKLALEVGTSYVECSAKTGEGVDNVFEEVSHRILYPGA